MHVSKPQNFLHHSTHLSLDGNCGYSVIQDRIVINIEKITSHRTSENLSGTLAIELWALKQPYHGGDFSGQALAATTIGELNGQHFLANCQYDLCFQEPAVGTWYLCLMLREWNGNGYETRDFLNFPVPYVVNWKPTVVTDNVVSIPVAEKADIAKLEASRKEKAITITKKAPEQKLKASPVNTKLSLNTASVDEIAEVKGVSKKLAKAIASARPFNSFEAVLEVKGMGEKLLKKIQEEVAL